MKSIAMRERAENEKGRKYLSNQTTEKSISARHLIEIL